MPETRPVIAIGNYDFRPSGTVVKSIEIATAAASAGLPVQLWVVRKAGELRERVPAEVPVVEIGSGLHSLSRSVDLAVNVPAIAAALRRHRPAVLLSGGNHLHLAMRSAMALSGQRRSIMLGARASNSAHHGKATRWRSLRARLDNRLKYGGSDFIIAVAHALGDEIRQALPDKDMSVIPNGVDLEKVERLAAQPFDHPFLTSDRGERPVLVTMGRLVRQKGFDLLIPALARVEGYKPTLMIIGDGTPAQKAALKALAEQEGIADRVALLGFQSNPFAILSRADLFVSASRWEGASNALIEALACGLPLVATDCPTGNREVVAAGPFGTLAPVSDIDGLAAAISAELKIRRSRTQQSAGAHLWSLDMCMAKWVDALSERLASIKAPNVGDPKPLSSELF